MTPIKPRKLSKEVEERLLGMIREQGLVPGDPVPSERQLMEQYQVGRPAIREAMQSLERLGLVEIRHGGRPRVAAPTIPELLGPLGISMRQLLTHSGQSLEHMKEARLELEAGMARFAAQRRTQQDLDQLRTIIDEQEAKASDPVDFLALDGRFHHRIAEISRNPIFALVTHAVFDWLREFHVGLVSRPGLEDLTLEEHRTILDAIERQNEDAAAKAMRDHLSRANHLYHQDNSTG